MTDPEVPKVLAVQVGNKIRLILDEGPPFWLEFEPLIFTGRRPVIMETQTVSIPQDCELYMDIVPLYVQPSLYYRWVKNGIETTVYDGFSWQNRAMSFDKDDQLLIKMDTPGAGSAAGAIILYLNDESGAKVAEFDYTYP